MLLLTSFSDWRQARGVPIMAVFIIGIVGWAILLGIPARTDSAGYSARYFGCICIVTAGYTNIPLIISWQSANNPQESQRAAALGFLNSIGQCLSLAAAFLFPQNEGPQYLKGSAINIAFQALGLLIALAMTLYFRFENKRRDKREGNAGMGAGGAVDVHDHYDLAPGKWLAALGVKRIADQAGFRYTT
jgi:hypothetical protein